MERCPLRTIQLTTETHPEIVDELERYVTTYLPAYRAGFLLERGGIAHQPARYVAIIEAISEMNARTDERYRELTSEPGDSPDTADVSGQIER